jgi:hypothetical protein
MKQLILLCCLIFAANDYSQNLLPNPGFELYSTCPNSFAQFNGYVSGWQVPSGHTGSPDFLHSCSGGSTCGVPVNTFGSQASATSGNGYVGLVLVYNSSANFREYIQAQLLAPLVAGQTYTFTLQASVADNMQYSSPNLGAYFSASPYIWQSGNTAPMTALDAQAVYFSSGAVNKTDWTTLTASYTATGGEQYVILGNFRDDAASTMQFVSAGTYNGAYVFLDDMSLVLSTPLNAGLTELSGFCDTEGSGLNWKTETGICTSYSVGISGDGLNFTDLGTVSGHASQTDYQFRSAQRYDGGIYYSLTGFNSDGEPKIHETIFFTCDQVAAAGELAFHHDLKGNIYMDVEVSGQQQLLYEVTDARGALVSRRSISAEHGKNVVEISERSLAAGVYGVRVTGETFSSSGSFTSGF